MGAEAGGDGASLVVGMAVDGVDSDVGVLPVGTEVPSEDRWNASRTTETTSATAATATAMVTARFAPVRYHGVGAGVKFQVLVLNASKACSSDAVGGAGSIHSATIASAGTGWVRASASSGGSTADRSVSTGLSTGSSNPAFPEASLSATP